MARQTGIVLAVIMAGLFLLFPLYVIQDRSRVLITSDSHAAQIVNCKARYFRGKTRASQLAGRKRWSYYPQARSEHGYLVTGTLGLPKKSQCERLLGKPVEILVNPERPSKARINSFTQFWFFPVLIIFGALFIILTFARRGGLAVVSAAAAVIVSIIGFRYELGLLASNDKVAPVAITVAPRLAMDVCVNEAMRQEAVTHASEIKRLVCKKRGLTELPDMSDLYKIEYLDLSLNALTDLYPLRHLPNLRELDLSGNKALESLNAIKELKKLETIDIAVTQISDLSPIAQASNIKKIDIDSTPVTDVSVLKNLPKLQSLNLANTAIVDISALADKPDLDSLTLYKTGVQSLAPLFGNANLRLVNISQGSGISCDEVRSLRRQIKRGGRVGSKELCPSEE